MSIPIPGRDRVIEIMRDLKIAKIEIHFSGGNDEGHAEPPAVTMKGNRKAIALPDSHWDWIAPRPSGSYSWTSPDTLEDDTPLLVQLAAGLDKPIDDQYGSFAGEFYVDGDVIWDANAGTCTMEHDYETPSSEHFSTEF